MVSFTTTNEPHAAALLAVNEQPLSKKVKHYIAYLAARRCDGFITLQVKAHPTHIAEDLLEELSAHTFCNPRAAQMEHHARELCELIAGLIRPLADCTLAHHLLVTLSVGKKLTPPHTRNGMAVCASLDCENDVLRRRFALMKETAPPPGEFAVDGMTLVCETSEPGFYRLPDDAQTSRTGLLQSDAALYQWTIRTLYLLHTMLILGLQVDKRLQEAVQRLNDKTYVFYHVLWGDRRFGEITHAKLAGAGIVLPSAVASSGAPELPPAIIDWISTEGYMGEIIEAAQTVAKAADMPTGARATLESFAHELRNHAAARAVPARAMHAAAEQPRAIPVSHVAGPGGVAHASVNVEKEHAAAGQTFPRQAQPAQQHQHPHTHPGLEPEPGGA